MTVPNFYLTTYLSRGRMEREITVEVEYTFDGVNLDIVSAFDRTEGRELSDYEWSSVEDAVQCNCERAYTEWMADYGEYLRDQAEDRRAA